MAPMTRSMARNMMEKNTVLIKDVMTTPGIATMIASNMHKDDRGLTSMYKLYNDDRYREEMDPFVFEKRIKKEMMEITALYYHFQMKLPSNISIGWKRP